MPSLISFSDCFQGHLLLEACRCCDLVLVKRLLNSTDDVHKTASSPASITSSISPTTATGMAAINSKMESPLPSIPGESGTPKKSPSSSLSSPTNGTPDLIHFRHPFSGDTTLHMAATSGAKAERNREADEATADSKSTSPSSAALISQRRQLIEFLISR